MSRRVLISILLVAGLAAGLVLSGCSNQPAKPASRASGVTAAPQADDLDVVSAEALVVPVKAADLSFKSYGRVEKLLVAEGDQVEQGQELVRLESNDLQLAIQQAQAALQSAQAQLAKLKAGARPQEIAAAEASLAAAQANAQAAQSAVKAAEGALGATKAAVDTAQATLQRAKNARASASDVNVYQKQVDQAQAAVPVAEAEVAQVRAQADAAAAQARQAQAQLDLIKAGSRAEDIAMAEASVAQARVRVAEAQNGWNDATLRAPFAGTVGSIPVNEGQLAGPQVVVIRLGDLSRMQVQTKDLSEADVNQIHVGQEASIVLDALPGQKFTGKVARIAPAASDNRGDKVYTVMIDVAVGQEAGLRWGMTAFVEITRSRN